VSQLAVLNRRRAARHDLGRIWTKAGVVLTEDIFPDFNWLYGEKSLRIS
jgi:hypothetical protein